MKKKILHFVTTGLFLMILMISAGAQESQQKKLRVYIEENGVVTTDTTVILDKSLSEEDIQAVISGITGESSYPCPAHRKCMKPCDTAVYKCKHAGEGELDSLPGASGHTMKHIHADSCIHVSGKSGHGPDKKCIKVISESESDSLPGVKTEKVKIIEIREGDVEVQEGKQEKIIEKKIIITEEGERAEKTIIMESPEKTEKSKQKPE